MSWSWEEVSTEQREREREAFNFKDILVPCKKILHTQNVLSISLHDESLDIYKSDSEIYVMSKLTLVHHHPS